MRKSSAVLKGTSRSRTLTTQSIPRIGQTNTRNVCLSTSSWPGRPATRWSLRTLPCCSQRTLGYMHFVKSARRGNLSHYRTLCSKKPGHQPLTNAIEGENIVDNLQHSWAYSRPAIVNDWMMHSLMHASTVTLDRSTRRSSVREATESLWKQSTFVQS